MLDSAQTSWSDFQQFVDLVMNRWRRMEDGKLSISVLGSQGKCVHNMKT